MYIIITFFRTGSGISQVTKSDFYNFMINHIITSYATRKTLVTGNIQTFLIFLHRTDYNQKYLSAGRRLMRCRRYYIIKLKDQGSWLHSINPPYENHQIKAIITLMPTDNPPPYIFFNKHCLSSLISSTKRKLF